MIYALYTAEQKIENDYQEVLKAFARGKVNFLRWDFLKDDNLLPELMEGQHPFLIQLKVENPRITPFITDEEVQAMFTVMLHEQGPVIFASSSYFQTDILSFTFPEVTY